MAKTLALIHTSQVFLNVETMMRNLFAEILPDVRLINIVDDSLLADVMAVGAIQPEVQQRMNAYVQAAALTGADAILSLCSSLGPTIDAARQLVEIPVLKIDDAMTAEAVRSADRIGVLATVATTLGPTVDLIRSKAADLDKPVEIRQHLVEGAFPLLLAGDKQQHDDKISAAAQTLVGQVELIVLAQASMTRLAPRLHEETGLRILTSPRLAIEYVRQVLDQLELAPARH
jgi:Asp/Glu/hydantoin racemase